MAGSRGKEAVSERVRGATRTQAAVPLAPARPNHQEMVNLQCYTLILTAHLKRNCQCRPEECVDLLGETGAPRKLGKVENTAFEFTSKCLRERECYILISVIPKESSEAICYESLRENLGKHYPDLAVQK
ncbi:PREDICTED: uncharacterized protein C22orf15 homolog [Leptosomus discolor]|uniref:uncharacterized protein C22orf15 homolog n=1 Tax=Leptosomus discolor TaxID=188344 RepID=UPI00052252CA|nr:PREDICTED: uncharacterized protein C22orf15 homolog [Leptosomus discolor]